MHLLERANLPFLLVVVHLLLVLSLGLGTVLLPLVLFPLLVLLTVCYFCVFVDRLGKRLISVLCNKEVDAQVLAQLYLCNSSSSYSPRVAMYTRPTCVLYQNCSVKATGLGLVYSA